MASHAAPLSLANAGGGVTSAASPIVASLSMPPWTACTVYPTGSNANDPSHSAIVFAGRDGKIHFTPPPADWGRKLTFDCGLTGAPLAKHQVNLDDTSTFTEESQETLAAKPVGTRAALTGDFTLLSNGQLLEQGYPPRPDPQADPGQYARWVAAVSTPVTVFEPVPITYLGLGMYGQYEGSTSCTWTGFVQSADNFPNLGCPLTTNWAGTTYSIYHFYSSVPWVTSGCGLGTNCATGIWAGIGGTRVAGFTQTSDLIQSGFVMQTNGNSSLFVEFAPGPISGPSLPTGDLYGRGDQFYIWGWSASQSSCAYTGSFNNTNFGCFGFQDITKGWTYSSTAMAQPIPPSSPSSFFLPTSGEMIAEMSTGLAYPPYSNANYTNTPGYGGFYDQNEAYHPDPGASSATDPYFYTQQNDGSGNPLNVATWANGTQYVPRDPATFIFQNSN